jgi:hypothetical protein
VNRSAEDRLARALDRVQAGGGSTSAADDQAGAEILELLETAGYLRENLTQVPAPDSFRRDLRDWLAQPRLGPWWRRWMEPARRRIPRGARRPAIGAAIGLGAAAAIVVGLIALRRRNRLASAV